ncbi:hypothetical protein PMAYCL1PPCAC_15120 [Pristionchus mayeri]|uniref:G protein-coupled receptor n=1 Tax=Pristionchus mayeri TaxID=1317129 RepID=A0AAN5HXL8_9BILA|nr:hypothetical protein PMAYCL1PPCAC_15119 [Pristionchus mayeri]GMR44925.1 hypothetical protein PMAYCL1PPCAC_15120 [Pristionchus mayeri]
MIVQSVADIMELILVTFIFGIMLIRGEVYCTHPRLQMCCSMAIEFFFFCSSIGCLLAALNRFGEVLSFQFIGCIFKGWRTWFAMLLLIIPCLFLICFTPLLLFNSQFHLMFFDPIIYAGRFKVKLAIACSIILIFNLFPVH